MFLEIVTPEAALVSGDVQMVSVPGVQGEFQVLDNHAAIVSTLRDGYIKFEGNPTFAEAFKSRFKEEGGKWVLPINSGTIEVNQNNVIILAD